jgi:pilus assembly protein CpaF
MPIAPPTPAVQPAAPRSEASSAAPPGTLSLLEQRRAISRQIHKELLERLDIKRMTAAHVERDELGKRAMETIRAIVTEVAPRLPPAIVPQQLVKDIFDEAMGLGPLEDLLEDPEITEIMVNGHSQVYVEKAGKLILTDRTFMNDDSVHAIIERIVSPLGRRIDESQPYVDARLPDGSRVNAIIPPLSLVGPCLTIRKFSRTPFTDQDLVRFGTITPSMAEFARMCVHLRKNVVVSGGTGSGKTTLLNVLSDYIPDSDRIVTIEDAAELRLEKEHIVRLESRAPNIEGRGAVTIRDLVRNALRMRPDRIIVGECRGAEALDMLQAMNTGHDGSLTTVHANAPRDVISRLETMVLMSGMDLPVRAIREQIASAIDLIVHEARFSDGTRKVTKITEVVGLEGDQITMQDIFEYTQTGVDAEGRVKGRFGPTGAVPTFIEEVEAHGLTIDRKMFDPMLWKE